MPSHLPKLPFFSLIAAAVVVLTGCASSGLKSSLLEQTTSEKAPGKLVAAVQQARSALENYRATGSDSSRIAYNEACAAFASAAKEARMNLPFSLQTPQGEITVRSGSGPHTIAFATATNVLLRSELQNQALVEATPLDGFGGAVVLVDRPPDPRAKLYPREGVSAAATAVLAFEEEKSATLTLYDTTRRTKAPVAGANRPLAADLGAPFGYYPLAGTAGFLGMLRPENYEKFQGIYLVQPYDPDKIPLVFIHGLMSTPQMWLPVMAAFEQDPELRGKFQFWAYAYPTGDPIAYLALQLREALAQMYEVYPDMKDMVIINHSLGGDLTHLQVIDSGDALVKAVFKEKADQILGLPNDNLLKRSLEFKANPRIQLVTFIATPHRGAPLAGGWLGNFGASLVRLPGSLVRSLGKETLEEAMALAGLKNDEIPNVVYGLEPYSPLLMAMCAQKMTAPCHSIIGVAGEPKSPLEKTSDTVVPYWSSHLDVALSEKIVDATHETICTHPEAIAEMKRIAKLYLQGERHSR